VAPGLYLEIDRNLNQRWIGRLQADGRRHDYGFGSFPKVSLKQAKEKVEDFRRALKDGRDPRIQVTSTMEIPTFREAAMTVWEERKPTWKNGKHVDQWINTLEQYAFPTIGNFRVDQVSHRLVTDLLAEIWLDIPETARRVAQRIKVVMDWCAARQFAAPISIDVVRAGLPKVKQQTKHFKSMPWQDVPDFIPQLLADGKTSKLALAFTILTAARSGEVRNMTWCEVDLESRLWRVDGSRMKMGRDHVVPLSGAAMAILGRVQKNDRLVFPNSKFNPLSDMTLTMLLRRMLGEAAPTVHGFRSSFTDWTAEETDTPREIVDASLAHLTGSKVDMAYRRTDFMNKRRKLMEDWGEYLLPK
jgi:integrase